MTIIEQAKSHPYIAGGIVLAVIVLTVMFSGGGSSSNTASAADASSANDINSMFAQISGAVQIAGIQAASHSEDIAGGKYAADLAAQTAQNANQLAANVALANINATQSVTNTANTLAAQIAENQANNSTQQLSISTAAQLENTRIVADALTKQAAINKPKSCTSVLFGLYSKC